MRWPAGGYRRSVRLFSGRRAIVSQCGALLSVSICGAPPPLSSRSGDDWSVFVGRFLPSLCTSPPVAVDVFLLASVPFGPVSSTPMAPTFRPAPRPSTPTLPLETLTRSPAPSAEVIPPVQPYWDQPPTLRTIGRGIAGLPPADTGRDDRGAFREAGQGSPSSRLPGDRPTPRRIGVVGNDADVSQ